MRPEGTLTIRQAWSKEIHAYLYDRLNAAWVAGERSPTDVDAMISALMTQETSLKSIATLAYFFRSGGFVGFSQSHLSGQFQHAAKTRVEKRATSSGYFRGRIDWVRTIQRRYTTGNDSLFDTTYRVPSYDSSENRVLAFLLDKILEVGGNLFDLEGTELEAIAADSLHRADETRGNVYLRGVKSGRPKTFERQRARRHRAALYQEAADLLDKIEGAIEQLSPESIIGLLVDGWLEPLRDDDIFEALTLIRTLKVVTSVVSARANSSITYRTVRSNLFVSDFSCDGLKIRVSYDRAPDTVCLDFGRDDYQRTRLLRHYDGISPSTRRPDIILMIKIENQPERHMLVEAKNTPASSKYARDSLYKVIGYVSDFERLWVGEPSFPKAILVLSEGLTHIDANGAMMEDIVLADQASYSTILENALRMALSTSP